jgi:hypothetical protein
MKSLKDFSSCNPIVSDGGNNGGKGITDSPQGLKLQAEGHDVRYRNIWMKDMDFVQAATDF